MLLSLGSGADSMPDLASASGKEDIALQFVVLLVLLVGSQRLLPEGCEPARVARSRFGFVPRGPEVDDQHPVGRLRNLGLLLHEPYRIGSEELHRRIAERGHPEVRTPHGNVFGFLDAGGT